MRIGKLRKLPDGRYIVHVLETVEDEYHGRDMDGYGYSGITYDEVESTYCTIDGPRGLKLLQSDDWDEEIIYEPSEFTLKARNRRARLRLAILDNGIDFPPFRRYLRRKGLPKTYTSARKFMKERKYYGYW